MADNVSLPGTGEVVATDDVGGVQYQQVKLVDSTLNSTTPIGTEANPLPVADTNSGNLLFRILQMLVAPLGYDKSLGRFRQTAILESGTVSTVGTVTTVSTVTTVTTCSTVSSLTNIAAIGGYSAQMQIMDTNRMAWADCVRARIT